MKMLRHGLFFAATSAALLLAACEPRAAEAPGPCDGLTAQPLRDVCILAADDMEGRMVGSEGGARARAYILSRFEEIGLSPAQGGFEQAFDVTRPVDPTDRDGPRHSLTGVNLIGVIEGEDPSLSMVITAHYDHLGIMPDGQIMNGADDNASGVGGLLAAAEYFLASPPRHTVVIAALDAEEGGLDGARYFVANRPEGIGEIAFNLNFDMLGHNEDGRLIAAGSYHTPELLPLIEAAAAASSITLEPGYDRPSDNRGDDWTMMSDHAAFHLAGIPFLYLGVEDHPYYHTPGDTFDIIMPGFYLGAVDTAIDVARRADAMLAEINAARLARAEAAE
ncbi:M28 family peptidase [Alkalicaulis satelles]|uniref:M28 family peptidase n=2 Tax=Alkalicaulis satelles TaxID=2609175 RepID=A0A5M6ZB47_9PROT|nr:M28 family peptidase [Alkalicaulis satelles]